MRLPPPCDDEYGRPSDRSMQHSEGSDEEGSPAQALQALDHYERAISALVSTTYSGLSSPERRQLLASLCREKQRLEQADGQTGTGE